jgi:hypothetical protein
MALICPFKQAESYPRLAMWQDIQVVGDGASCHTCKLAKGVRTKLGISSCIHHPSSPDLSLVENVGYLLKPKVSQLTALISNLDMLWEQGQACWADLDQGYMNKVINGIPEKVEAACHARGEVPQF